MRTARNSKARATDVMTMGEIEQRYPKEWVLVEITREAKKHERIVGRLLAHSPDPEDLDEPHRRFRAEHPRALLYEHYTGPVELPDDTIIII